jgi:hypothetical protein
MSKKGGGAKKKAAGGGVLSSYLESHLQTINETFQVRPNEPLSRLQSHAKTSLRTAKCFFYP